MLELSVALQNVQRILKRNLLVGSLPLEPRYCVLQGFEIEEVDRVTGRVDEQREALAVEVRLPAQGRLQLQRLRRVERFPPQVPVTYQSAIVNSCSISSLRAKR